MFLLGAIKVRKRQSDTQEPAVEIGVGLKRMNDGLCRVAKGCTVLLDERADL